MGSGYFVLGERVKAEQWVKERALFSEVKRVHKGPLMSFNWPDEGNLKCIARGISTSWTKRSPNPNLSPKSSTDPPSRFHSSVTPACARSMSLNPLSFPPLPSQDLPHDS